MGITRTSSLSTATLEGLRDEFLKIAEDSDRKKKFKRWAKNTALISAGVGAGEGASRLVEKVTKDKFGPKWTQMPKSKRLNILRAGTAALGAASAGAGIYFTKKHHEASSE